MSDLDKARREEARWRILGGLNAGRPYAVTESILFRLLHDVKLPLSPLDVRRELGYLEDRGLVKLADKDGPVWSAELTRAGVDVVEYTVDCDPGIARPPKFW
jgi:hypothetical protein